MSAFVVDTSVVVAWYLPEEFSDAAREWQGRMLDGRIRLVTPRLHYWELANVLRTYVRRGEIEEELAREIYELHFEAPLELVEPAAAEVLDTALDFETTAYDAVFIALARTLEVPLVTAERSTTPWVVRLGDGVEAIQ